MEELEWKKVRYMISDAANIVKVESHVLRYWEEELELDIPRNELGHRYYTKENIQEFQKIKELKEQGYQLKAIRMIVHNLPIDTQPDFLPVEEKKPDLRQALPDETKKPGKADEPAVSSEYFRQYGKDGTVYRAYD